jgi:hypothetical protein
MVHSYKIFVDLDGVLCDFAAHVKRITGLEFQDCDALDTELWQKVHAIQESGQPFYSIMDKTPDADQLWQYVRPYNPAILTSTGKYYDYARAEKCRWVHKHLVGYSDIITVPRSVVKSEHAAHNHILIDDRTKSIGPWREAGGIGILHTSAQDTIEKLAQLGV